MTATKTLLIKPGLSFHGYFLEIWRAQNPSKITKNNSQGCEAANPLRAPKPRKNKSRSTNRSKVGFLEIRKVGRKLGRKVGQKGVFVLKNQFSTYFSTYFPDPRKTYF